MNQRRETDGKFGEKVGSAPETALTSSLEPKMEEFEMEEGVTYPDVPHPIHPGLSWGISRSEHWNDYAVDTGYFGGQPQKADIKPGEPPRWVANAPDFETAATIWQHRDDINAALRANNVGDRYRLRIQLDKEKMTIGEYDWDSFGGIVVRRRDV